MMLFFLKKLFKDWSDDEVGGLVDELGFFFMSVDSIDGLNEGNFF